MTWTTRVALLLMGSLLALGVFAGPQAEPVKTGTDAWPAPDEDSIEYLKTIDLLTLRPRDMDLPIFDRVDLFGQPLQPDEAVRLCYSAGVTRLAVSPDGRFIAASGPGCSSRAVEIFNAATGSCLRQLGAHQAMVEAMVFSPDGSRLAVARSDLTGFRDLIGSVTLYDTESFDVLATFGEGTGPRTLAFSPDGKALASGGGDGIVWFWDPGTGEKQRGVADLTRKVVSLAFSPNGKQLATSSKEDVIRIWDVASGTPLQQINHDATHLEYSPDGRHLATERSVYELANGTELPRFRPESSRSKSTFSPDGRSIACFEENGITVRELSTGQVRRTIAFQSQQGYGVPQAAFSPDGRILITGMGYGGGTSWNITGVNPPKEPPRLSDLEAWMVDIAEAQPQRAYAAVWRMVAAGKAAVPLLTERLKQPAPPPVDPQRLERLLAELDNADFHVRDRATLELEQLGRESEKPLRELLADRPPLEVRIRVEHILARIADRGGRLPQELFRLRALEVLENMVATDSRAALVELAERAKDPQIKEDAQQSLERQARRRK